MYEQLYNDFTTKLLPHIQEGLVITKDYFLDLFARYIKYLIISDALSIAFCATAAIVLIAVLWKLRIWAKKELDDFSPFPIILYTIGFIALAFAIGGAVVNTSDLIKDIYIPEVRIYEELQKQRTSE